MFPFDAVPVFDLIPCLAGPAPGGRTSADELRNFLTAWMSEVRQHVDIRTNYFPSGGPASSPLGTDADQLAFTLDLAASGVAIDPRDVIRQLPSELRGLLETFSRDRYKKGLDTLSRDESRDLCKLLVAANSAAGIQAPSGPGGVSASRRSEMRVDSRQSFFPSGTSMSDKGLSWRMRFLVAAVATVLLVAALLAWRYLG